MGYGTVAGGVVYGCLKERVRENKMYIYKNFNMFIRKYNCTPGYRVSKNTSITITFYCLKINEYNTKNVMKIK